MNNSVWMIYIRSTKVKIGPYKTKALLALFAVKKWDPSDVKVLHNTWTEWKKLNDVPELLSYLNPQPVGSIAGHIQRRHIRVNSNFKVVFMADSSRTFRTFTKDISEGGMRIADPLPIQYVNIPLTVYITSVTGHENIKLAAQVVLKNHNACHIEFLPVLGGSMDVLKNWILQLQTPIPKKKAS